MGKHSEFDANRGLNISDALLEETEVLKLAEMISELTAVDFDTALEIAEHINERTCDLTSSLENIVIAALYEHVTKPEVVAKEVVPVLKNAKQKKDKPQAATPKAPAAKAAPAPKPR